MAQQESKKKWDGTVEIRDVGTVKAKDRSQKRPADRR
jgi:hypothetical protein